MKSVHSLASKMNGLVWVVGLVLLAFLSILVLFLCIWRRRRPLECNGLCRAPSVETPADSADHKELRAAPQVTTFPYRQLRNAAGNLSDAAMIGKGKFGAVYKAQLKDGVVAVKRITKDIEDGTCEQIFKEIDTASNLRHRNLVRLIGYSSSPNNRLLLIVMEYISNGTLHEHLFPTKGQASTSTSAPPPTRTRTRVLSWETRYKIARGLAAGVDYLHNGTTKCVIHRDIKPMNVMLNRNWTPKLGDFGMSRLTNHGESMITTAAGGTYGYLAPEYSLYVRLFNSLALMEQVSSGVDKSSTMSDVFAVGIILLQIGTGKELMVEDEGLPLVSWVWNLGNNCNILAAVDERLGNAFVEEEAERLLVTGLLCCHTVASHRPNMSQVKAMLDGHISLKEMEVKPLKGYFKSALDRASMSLIAAEGKPML
ncbi:hypothetical protein V2J09_001959 [Rumex salicifolius]